MIELLPEAVLRQVQLAVRRAVAEAPDRSDRDIATAVAAGLTAEVTHQIVVGEIESWCWSERRSKQRDIERAHQVPVQSRGDLAQQDRETTFARLLADPSAMYGPGAHAVHLGRRRDREAFTKWCGERFADWQERAHQHVETHCPSDLGLFLGDWHPNGPYAHARERTAESIGEFVRDYAQKIRLELTEELLASEFALGDGRRVTWGSATIAEHEQRITLLQKNAAANVEASARHRSAVETIRAATAVRLSDVVAPGKDTMGMAS